MVYEYLLVTWGGLYNLPKVHNHKEGRHYFPTKESRAKYMHTLRKLNRALGNLGLVMDDDEEGYHVRTITTLHRMSEYKGVRKHTTYELNSIFSHSTAKFNLENKWYPGHNDYPFGECVDYYTDKEFKIIQEWITGSFNCQLE